jgi:hypothetical protein
MMIAMTPPITPPMANVASASVIALRIELGGHL